VSRSTAQAAGRQRARSQRNDLKAGEWVNIRCQAYDFGGHTGERLGLFDKAATSSSPTSA
jgi:hypothetical protein